MSLLSCDLLILLEAMQDPRRDALLAIYDEWGHLFHHASGSSHNHQAWKGGYADHIAECIRVNMVLYPALAGLRPVPFSMDSATLCLFFHDIEKPIRYGYNMHPEVQRWTKRWARRQESVTSPATWEARKWEILEDLQQRYDFVLTDDEINALRYTHGEGSDHRKDKRVSGPLAAHVHHCDNTSARIWPEDGRGLG